MSSRQPACLPAPRTTPREMENSKGKGARQVPTPLSNGKNREKKATKGRLSTASLLQEETLEGARELHLREL